MQKLRKSSLYDEAGKTNHNTIKNIEPSSTIEEAVQVKDM